MKNILIIASAIMIIACSKSNNCTSVQYKEVFVAQTDNTYYFNDGNELTVDSLVNAYCPCNVTCFWEGEAEVHMTWNINGEAYSFVHHSSDNIEDETDAIPLDFIIESDNVVFEVPCDNNNPSPAIVAMDIIVTTN